MRTFRLLTPLVGAWVLWTLAPGSNASRIVWAEDQTSTYSAESSPAAAALTLDPSEVRLVGAHERFTLLAAGLDERKRPFDVTYQAQYRSLDPNVCVVSERGLVSPTGDGRTVVEAVFQGKTARTVVVVQRFHEPRRFAFEDDVMPLLTRYSCNTSSCHGKAEGQNGFKLSVFGFDETADYEALTVEARGRRVFPAAPARSLLLTKPTNQAPHAGGLRLPVDGDAYHTLLGWIAAGSPRAAADAPKVLKVRIDPQDRVLQVGGRQPLRVTAEYSDGRSKDVTHLARFQSNQEGLASVDGDGLITAGNLPGQAAVMANFLGHVAVIQAMIPRPGPALEAQPFPAHNFIDPLAERQWRKLNLQPSDLCDDPTFLRRVYLDVIGVLPTADEARAFLADPRPDKRAKLVDALLERPEFADFWSLRWADLLRVDVQTLGRADAYRYYRWMRDSVAQGKPFDRFAAELVAAEGPLSEAPAGNFFRVEKKPGQWSSAVAQVFLGLRIACAECHHHPYDRWSQTDYYGMQAFFAQTSVQNTLSGPTLTAQGSPETRHPRTLEVVHAHALGQPRPEASPEGDRRKTLAAWMTSAENPWFARNLANRLWAYFLGRGLVEPVDDVRETNPPTNPELLDALAAEVVRGGFDLRHMIRAITASRTYQLSSQTNEANAQDEQNFSRSLFRRLQAEVLLDAVCQTTGVPEKFEGLPSGYRAAQLWDNRTPHYFLKVFGRPLRATPCECERASDASVGQVLHLMNSPEIQAKLSHAGGRTASMVRTLPDDGALADALYLAYYSRYPSPTERASAVAHLSRPGRSRRHAAEDLAWSLLNTLEFVFNH